MRAIKLFFEVYRAGVFINNPTQAYRAIRSVEGFKEINSNFLKNLEGPSVFGIVENPIYLMFDLTLTVVQDMRENIRNTKNMNTMLRELLIPIHNYFVNLESDFPQKKTIEYKVRVSNQVIENLRLGKKPDVVFEHYIPVKVMRDEMIACCYTTEEIIEYLKVNLKGVYITKEEDQQITRNGFRQDLPRDRDRYTSAGIKIHERLVYFRRGHSSMKHIQEHQ